MPTVQLVTLSEGQGGDAAALIARAFRDEPINRRMLDLDDRRTREPFERLVEARMTWLLMSEQPVLCALHGTHPVAVVAMHRPGQDPSLLAKLWMMLTRVPQLAPLLLRLRWSRIWDMRALRRPSGDVPRPHYTVDMVAVEPEYQRQGLARRLLGWAHEIAAADDTVRGIYLQTGGDRNRTVYERLGYDAIGAVHLDGLVVYDMFRPIEQQ